MIRIVKSYNTFMLKQTRYEASDYVKKGKRKKGTNNFTTKNLQIEMVI